MPEENPCTAKVLAVVNRVFKSAFTLEHILPLDVGLHGGAWNIVLYAVDLPAEIFNRIQPGRYALSWKNYLFGGGTHLHIPGGGENLPCSPAIPFFNSNIGGETTVRFTAHLDHGYPYHPFGFFYHQIQDVAMASSRGPCP